jgi:hypothetical protein
MDNAEQNPDFKKFRDRLIDAVKKKDVRFLLEHTDDNIRIGFGDPDIGIKNFVEAWKLNKSPEKSKIWHELGEVLRLGGAFDDDEKTSFVAPIFFAKWPSIFDAFEYYAINGEKVNVRSEPNSKSNIVTKLNYDIIKATNLYDPDAVKETINGETYQWVEIHTLYGVHGYVFGKYVRSPIDYRAIFKKESGVWKMIAFVIGD